MWRGWRGARRGEFNDRDLRGRAPSRAAQPHIQSTAGKSVCGRRGGAPIGPGGAAAGAETGAGAVTGAVAGAGAATGAVAAAGAAAGAATGGCTVAAPPHAAASCVRSLSASAMPNAKTRATSSPGLGATPPSTSMGESAARTIAAHASQAHRPPPHDVGARTLVLASTPAHVSQSHAAWGASGAAPGGKCTAVSGFVGSSAPRTCAWDEAPTKTYPIRIQSAASAMSAMTLSAENEAAFGAGGARVPKEREGAMSVAKPEKPRGHFPILGTEFRELCRFNQSSCAQLDVQPGAIWPYWLRTARGSLRDPLSGTTL